MSNLRECRLLRKAIRQYTVHILLVSGSPSCHVCHCFSLFFAAFKLNVGLLNCVSFFLMKPASHLQTGKELKDYNHSDEP